MPTSPLDELSTTLALPFRSPPITRRLRSSLASERPWSLSRTFVVLVKVVPLQLRHSLLNRRPSKTEPAHLHLRLHHLLALLHLHPHHLHHLPAPLEVLTPHSFPSSVALPVSTPLALVTATESPTLLVLL